MFFNGANTLIPINFTPVFIGGPGRSGTSVLQATLCGDFESGNTNQYVGECSYLMKLLDVYFNDLPNFSGMTYSYFDEKEELFFLYHANLIRNFLKDKWEFLGRPKNLILKAPALIQHFLILSQACPEARFIITTRNPLDLAASMKNVVEKYQDETNFNTAYIKDFCNGLMNTYAIHEKSKKFFEDRLMVVKYEDFIRKKLDPELEKFLGIKIIEDKIWHSKFFKSDKGWLTDKYKSPRQDSGIDNYKEKLSKDEIEQVASQCSGLMSKFSYQVPSFK